VFEVTPEITSVVEFAVGMTRGLVRDNVFVSVMLRLVVVALRRDQRFPPADVAVVAGSVIALNAELVM
jgi:hypothetical protein